MQGLHVISANTKGGSGAIASPKELGEMLLASITSPYSDGNGPGPFNRNYCKLIGQVTFCVSLMLPFD